MPVFPNSRNVIPGEIKFSADLRNSNADVLIKMDEEFQAFYAKVAKKRNIGIDVDNFWYFAPVEFKASDDVKKQPKI